MPRLQCIQHVPFEGLGRIETFARVNGFSVSTTRIYENDPFPGPESFDWLVVMGGPMSVYEENAFPWITEEKKCIDRAIAAHKKVIGICLGAQLIASVLGARVYPNHHKEIGWFPVSVKPRARDQKILRDIPDRFLAFHWHGDRFDIPWGAVHFAGSEACENQGFFVGDHVLGLQFHCESTRKSVELLVEQCANDIGMGQWTQGPSTILSNMHNIREINVIMDTFLANFLNSPIGG
jgi:GMP synthase-like glutamine amidotransferase